LLVRVPRGVAYPSRLSAKRRRGHPGDPDAAEERVTSGHPRGPHLPYLIVSDRGNCGKGTSRRNPRTWDDCPMPWYIELSLSNGGTLHLDADQTDPVGDLKRRAKRSASADWVKTVEGAWVNQNQIVSAVVVDLPAAPTPH